MLWPRRGRVMPAKRPAREPPIMRICFGCWLGILVGGCLKSCDDSKGEILSIE